ncbi:DnaJ-class molecular chaperone [Rhodovulum iodosum]|uniref:DnaJ-class molecular chaperone n=1 Tax=Rhodovulum iodosum TaxID=68291 RepID=A0ABV3XVY3_9RHOB|nr:hypothetical protein [Rhodovulum robiginosum]RSK36436.1 hypothetical protein EJA01_05165 [Rhodovulum robiginosum]
MKEHVPRKKQMPHIKRRCHRCRGTGREPCQVCGGKGQVMKGTDMRGHPQWGTCDGCMGLKTKRCAACGGEGFA